MRMYTFLFIVEDVVKNMTDHMGATKPFDLLPISVIIRTSSYLEGGKRLTRSWSLCII